VLSVADRKNHNQAPIFTKFKNKRTSEHAIIPLLKSPLNLAVYQNNKYAPYYRLKYPNYDVNKNTRETETFNILLDLNRHAGSNTASPPRSVLFCVPPPPAPVPIF
jgi:hypothetical protein